MNRLVKDKLMELTSLVIDMNELRRFNVHLELKPHVNGYGLWVADFNLDDPTYLLNDPASGTVYFDDPDPHSLAECINNDILRLQQLRDEVALQDEEDIAQVWGNVHG